MWLTHLNVTTRSKASVVPLLKPKLDIPLASAGKVGVYTIRHRLLPLYICDEQSLFLQPFHQHSNAKGVAQYSY